MCFVNMVVKECYADEEWQSTPTATPQLMQPKPPRITPPPLLSLQAQADSRPPVPDTLPEALSSLSVQSDSASPSGGFTSSSQPVPCCSPEVKRFHIRHKRSPHAQASCQAQLCSNAGLQLDHLPPAVPSITPTLPHVSSRRRHARCMQSSEDQSTVRAFPDLDFASEALGEALPAAASHVGLMSARYWHKASSQNCVLYA